MTENSQGPSKEKKYSEEDMLAAFKHGLEFEPYPNPYSKEIDPSCIPEENRPFWEWLRIHDKRIIQPPPKHSLILKEDDDLFSGELL